MTNPDPFSAFDEWQIDDDELNTINCLLANFTQHLNEVFGTRAKIVLANAIGSWLAHAASEEGDGVFVFFTVDGWLRVHADVHGGMPLALVFGDDAVEVRRLDSEQRP